MLLDEALYDEAAVAIKCYSTITNFTPSLSAIIIYSTDSSQDNFNIKNNSRSTLSTENILKNLTNQVFNLEKSTYYKPEIVPTPELTSPQHEQVQRARTAVASSNLYSATFQWVPEHYYSLSLLERAKILGASSTYQLCKSMLMENKAFDPSLALSKNDKSYAQFYLIILQYEATITNKKLQNEIRALRPAKQRLDPSKFDFRVASQVDNDRLTGYTHNAVSPFGMKKAEEVPIVLAKAIVTEERRDMSQFIWMGGGHVHLKIGLAVEDLVKGLDAAVLDVTDARSSVGVEDDGFD